MARALRWDSSRTVPWKRLTIEWAVVAAVVMVVIGATNKPVANGAYTLLFSGVIYLGFGALMAKLGYARKSLAQLRAEAAAAPPRQRKGVAPTQGPRPRPAPTRRTSTGPNRPASKKR